MGRRHGTSLLYCLAFLLLGVHTGWAQVTWDGGGDGTSWSDPLNWNPDVVPTAGDDVVIGFFATITINENVTINSLSLTSASLVVLNEVTINGTMTWSGGTFDGNGGVVRVMGATSLEGGTKTVGSGATVELSGGGTWVDGSVGLENGSVLRVPSGQVLSITDAGAASLFRSGTITVEPVFEVAGVLRKEAASTSTTSIDVEMAHTGNTIEVFGGQLHLGYESEHTGTITVSSGASVVFDSGTHTLAGATTSGEGLVSLTFGTVNVLSGTTLGSSWTQSSGTLVVSDTLHVPGAWTWTGGTIDGTGVVSSTGGVSLEGGTKTLGAGVTVELSGGGTWVDGSVALENGSVLRVPSGQVLSITDAGAASLFRSGTITVEPVFEVAGVLRKEAASTSTTSIDVEMAHTGNTIEVLGGQLHLGYESEHTGTITVSSGASVVFDSGTHTLAGATTSGEGLVSLTFGTVNVLSGTTLGSSWTQSSGTLVVSDTLHVPGAWTWTGGTIDGTGVVSSTGGVSLEGGTKTLGAGVTVELSGGGTWVDGSVALENGSVLRVPSGQVLSITDAGAASLFRSGTITVEPVFEVAGVLRKEAASTSTTSIDVEMAHTGNTIEVLGGQLHLGYESEHTGTITVSSGASVVFDSGTHTLAGATTSGEGLVSLTFGTVNVLSGTTLGSSWTQSSGTLVVSDTLHVPGAWTWTGGTIDGTGVVSSTGGVSLEGGTKTLGAGVTVELSGGGTWVDGSVALENGSVLRVPSGQVLSITDAGAASLFRSGTITDEPVFEVAGVLRKETASTSTTTLTVDVRIASAGEVDIQGGGLSFGFSSTNEGLITVQGLGLLTFSGSGGHTNAASGVIQGTGNIEVFFFAPFVNNGTISPGLSPGILTFKGDLEQETTSRLLIELGGSEPGSGYDQLIVEGEAMLGGTLDVVLLNGFSPSENDVFTILTSTEGIMGGFSGMMGLVDEGAGVALYPAFGEMDVTLTAVSGIPTLGDELVVTPNVFQNGTVASMVLTGGGFAPDVSVRLVCTSCADPVAHAEVPVEVTQITPDQINGEIDLTPPLIYGGYDVVVSDPRGGEVRAPVSIFPSDLAVSIEALDDQASEEGQDPGIFRIQTTQVLTSDLPVRLQVEGSATRFLDYSLGLQGTLVTIPAGQSSTTITVVPLVDNEVEGNETVVLTIIAENEDPYVLGSPSSATITIADGPGSDVFDLLTSQPDRGGAGPVTLTITGQNISPDATATLQCGDGTAPGFNPVVNPNGTSMQVLFDLTGFAEGPCDLTVTNGDGASETLTSAFTIEAIEEPDLWLELISPERRRNGREALHRIIITNRGNVDAYMVPVEIHVNEGATINPEFDLLTPDPPELDDFTTWDDIPLETTFEGANVMPVVLPLVPAGGEIELTFRSDASTVTAVVSTPMLTSFSPVTGKGELADPYVQALAEQLAVLGVGDLAQCVFNKFGLVLANALGATIKDLAGCITQVGNQLATLAVIGLNAYQGKPVGWASLRLGVSVIATVVKCAGKNIPWVRYGGLAINLILATIDVAQNCRENPRSSETEEVASFDPNDKLGPAGVDAARYFRGEEERLFYTIRFENKAEATAPAAEVLITDTLDTNVYDLSTFRLGSFTFGDSTVSIPPGLKNYATTLDLRPDMELLLQFSASLDETTAIASWKFTSLDPVTMDLPEDPLLGFLPPNQEPPEGEGSVSFFIGLKEGLASGTTIANEAKIFFDLNEPIDTPIWVNVLDRSSPESRVVAAEPGTMDSTLVLTLTGSDDASGVLYYTIYVSEAGGPFAVWAEGVPVDTVTFVGDPGQTYAFYSIATDKVGNVEPAKSEAEVETVIPVGIEEISGDEVPKVFELYGNYPNPFSLRTTIRFDLPRAGEVRLRVYDVLGREVARLIDERRPAGRYRITWDADNLPSGVYFYVMEMGKEVRKQKMVLVR